MSPNKMILDKLNREDFLLNYWQKQPLLVRNAWPGFNDPISAEELAGLSLEEEVDARLIISKPDWQQFSSPLEESLFSQLPEQDWTLLVQSVETWIPELRSILDQFSFIPNWRLDDLMVSYAVPGGTVGPHLDQYDVFLLQGSGQRHWQVGSPQQSVKEHLPHPLIKQVESFEPIINELLQPGDLLYIPPNTPHHGVATEPCLTYSIGFRAPSQHNLLEQLLVDLIEQDESKSSRYKDQLSNTTGAKTSPISDRLLPEDIINWSRNTLEQVSDEQLTVSFGQLVTRLKHDLTEEDPRDIEQIESDLINSRCDLICHPDSRLAHYKIENKHLLFINGKSFRLSRDHSEWIEELCLTYQLSRSLVKKRAQGIEFVSTIAILVKAGWLLFNHN